MASRPDLKVLGASAAVLLVVAFVISFVFGLRSRGGTVEPLAPADILEAPPQTPAGRVEVLNASGTSGLARAAMDRLRDGGFDVVYYGNASAQRDTSVVLDRTGNDAVARAAARRLDIARVQTQVDTTLYLDATVIIGKDWPKKND